MVGYILCMVDIIHNILQYIVSKSLLCQMQSSHLITKFQVALLQKVQRDCACLDMPNCLISTVYDRNYTYV